ncbi:protein roadkill-like [Thrips palmi]|uniref:Protein roadkill-like n=1 Tax=Thrips palmi TaxID=161013 RepID=A0A6P8Y3L8_THRPL|nr:protein roadkill-like [Thrips palmi]XP_034234104.1 protein roadkill-like [Thrips palmi]XP_034234105.1 protein roadkill-like [Thrips palmi]
MSWPVMTLRRKVYRANQIYHVDRWCLICGQEVRHRFSAPNDTSSGFEWELVIAVSQSKWNGDDDPRMDISLKPKPKQGPGQGQNKARLYAEVTFTVDEHRKNDTAPKRYTVLKFNMARVEEEGYSEVLRGGSEGTGMPIKPCLSKVVVSIKLIYLDGPLEVITVNEPKPNPEDIPQRLGKLLESGRLSDVIFEVEGKEIKAHRAIIAAMSETFSAMFEHDLAEKKTGRVVITDCEFIVFQAMLTYIYTGGEPTWNKCADFPLQLLLVADKYGLIELRSMCLARLLRSLTPANALTTYLTFQNLNLPMGVDFTFSYLRENKNAVLASSAWRDILENDPRKAADILMRVVSQPDTMDVNLPSLLPATTGEHEENTKRQRQK